MICVPGAATTLRAERVHIVQCNISGVRDRHSLTHCSSRSATENNNMHSQQ